MALSFDNSKDGGNATNTTITISYTNGGNILFAGIRGSSSGSDQVSGVSYNGVSMSKISSSQKDSRWCSFWFVASPAKGTNNLVITNSISDFAETTIASYNNARTILDQSTSGTGTGNLTQSITTTIDKDWTVAFGGSTAGDISAGAGTKLRQANASGASGIFDSNGVISPAGSTSLTMNTAGNPTAMIMAGFSPANTGGLFAVL